MTCIVTMSCHRKFIHRTNTASCSHGMVRLVNGANIYEGRVEVCLQGIWKTVCDDFWGNSEARVVCTQLGFQGDGKYHTCCSYTSIKLGNVGAQAFGQAHFGQGSGLILEEIVCFGHELSLTACHYHDENDSFCHHVEDAGVQCCKCYS